MLPVMNPLILSMLALFAILSLGIALGKIRLGGISLDNAAVIFVALIFGHFGILIPEIFQSLGLVLFVFSVGMQSGPGFLSSFSRNGLKMILPTAAMILVSAALMLVLAAVLHLDLRLALGLFTGGRSSNSALAIGVQSTASNLPAIGHSLAYPVAVLGILLFIRLVPTLFRAKVAEEEKAFLEQQRLDYPPLETRTFLVDNPNVFNRTLDDLHIGRLTGVNVSRIMHEGTITVPGAGFVLSGGDLVKAVGQSADLAALALLLGPEVSSEQFPDLHPDQANEARWFTITNKAVVNLSLNRLALLETYGATVTRLQRQGIELSPHGPTVLRYADRVMVVAERSAIEALGALLGDPKRTVDKDFLPLFSILTLGLLLGAVQIPVSDTFTLSLGMTGGVLIASLVLSALGRTGPILWVVSESSARFIRQLGLLLFLGAVGTSAGSQLAGILANHGLLLLGAALLIAVLPLALMALFCRLVLRMNILQLMGLLSGATTCSPALGVVNSLSSTNIANVAYATVFPFALIFMMVCAQIIAAWY